MYRQGPTDMCTSVLICTYTSRAGPGEDTWKQGKEESEGVRRRLRAEDRSQMEFQPVPPGGSGVGIVEIVGA